MLGAGERHRAANSGPKKVPPAAALCDKATYAAVRSSNRGWRDAMLVKRGDLILRNIAKRCVSKDGHKARRMG
jgi:hypothetical protein